MPEENKVALELTPFVVLTVLSLASIFEKKRSRIFRARETIEKKMDQMG